MINQVLDSSKKDTTMGNEVDNRSTDLNKVALGIAGMFGIYWIYTAFIAGQLSISSGLKTAIGMLLLYAIGLGIFLFFTRKIDKQKYAKNKVPTKTLLICFLLQFTALMVRVAIGFLEKDSSTDDIFTISPLMLFMLLIFNPIVEELVFRHLFATRLLKHGERFYILVSAFCFAIVHGFSLGFQGTIYPFLLGLIYAYLMVKTGNLILVMIMHALSNLFATVMIQFLFSVSKEAALIYMILLMVLAVIGLVLFLRNRKNIVLDGTPEIFDKAVLKEVFTNKGILFFTAFSVIIVLLKRLV